MINRLQQLAALGQSIWLDSISRELIDSGRLEELVNQGVTGVTSNPAIFNQAITGSTAYDGELRRLAQAGRSATEIYEALVLRDIADAADILRPVYNETHGRDGYVSLEVSPLLAHDTEGTVAEARRLFAAVGRPNVMIKVPATEAGLPAITTLLGEGVNVNVTLIFALDMYERVMQAYLEGLRKVSQGKRPLGLVSSVASFFVSRVDTLVDRLLKEREAEYGEERVGLLYGQAAVANAKLAYVRFKAVFGDGAFAEFRVQGARPQRPLWASTSTKNPEYPDTKYVDPLIGPFTVNTVPMATLEALVDHGVVAQTIDDDLPHAEAVMQELAAVGIDMRAVTDRLLDEGVQKFAQAYEQLLAAIERKRAALARPA